MTAERQRKAKPEAPPYPGFGTPCNGCGVCCLSEQCKIGAAVRPAPEGGHCVFLAFEEGRFWCGLIRDPEGYGIEEHWPFLVFRMGIGAGCDSEGEL